MPDQIPVAQATIDVLGAGAVGILIGGVIGVLLMAALIMSSRRPPT